MKASTRNVILGTFHEMKGSVRTTLGNSLSNRRLAISGHIERVGGIVQSKFGSMARICGW